MHSRYLKTAPLQQPPNCSNSDQKTKSLQHIRLKFTTTENTTSFSAEISPSLALIIWSSATKDAVITFKAVFLNRSPTVPLQADSLSSSEKITKQTHAIVSQTSVSISKNSTL